MDIYIYKYVLVEQNEEIEKREGKNSDKNIIVYFDYDREEKKRFQKNNIGTK